VVNQLHRNKEGKLFAAADEGVFIYEHDRFKHLSFENKDGQNVGVFIVHIQAVNNELMLVQCDESPNKSPTLYLYNYRLQKILSEVSALDFCKTPGNNYWVLSPGGLHAVDLNALIQNKLELEAVACPV
jgi:hypothetical protein